MTNFSVWVVPWSSSISSTSPLSFMQMFAPNWRMTYRRGAPRAPGIASLRSHPRFQQGNPELAPPWPCRFHHNVAIMLDGVTSTGTRLCRLRSRSHHRRAADEPTTGCCAPVSVKPRAGPRIKPIPPQSWKHHQTTCKTTHCATKQKHLLAKRNSWLQIEECPSVLDSDTLSPYVQVVCNGSRGCVFSARLQ